MKTTRGFTLMELMISMAISMVLAGLTTTAFIQIRSAVNRAEARLTMHASVQAIYTHLHRSFSSLAQSCAFLVTSTASTGPGNGEVSITFMRGKESTEDFNWWVTRLGNSDLLWEQWTWKRADQTLYSAVNRPVRAYTINTPFTVGGANFNGTRFESIPQPRRWLDPAAPLVTLDDNSYFPSPSTPGASLAHPQDMGDHTDLQRERKPALDLVSDFAVQILAHDGTTDTVSDAATTTVLRQGAWVDGRLAPTLTAPQDFATSDAAKRPKIVRLRFTLTEPRSKLTQTFAFSFALPGMQPNQ